MRAWNVAADDELLPKIDAVLRPYVGMQAGLIDAVRTLGDDALKPIGADEARGSNRRESPQKSVTTIVNMTTIPSI
jgi:hypothetical protein